MACQIKYVEKPRPKPAPSPNPYKLIDLIINGKPIQGRPIAWDSAIADHSNQLNDRGEPVLPTLVITLCPDCRQMIEWDLSFGVDNIDCPNCRPPIPPPVITPLDDPYCNPFETGIINFDEVSLDLISMLNSIPDNTVTERKNHISELEADMDTATPEGDV